MECEPFYQAGACYINKEGALFVGLWYGYSFVIEFWFSTSFRRWF